MDPERPYDGWWFVAEEQYTEREASNSGAKKEPNNVTWFPFPSRDRDYLEQAYQAMGGEGQEEAYEVAVHNKTGQRLSKVNLRSMTMEPLYWKGNTLPVRRASWMLMRSEEDMQGGNPVAPEWDIILEQVYQEASEWIHSTHDPRQVIEKIVELSDPLSSYVMVLRQGITDNVVLTPKAELEKPPMFGKMQNLRLIRGYLPYYIAVISALSLADKSKTTTEPMPLSLPSPFEDLNISPPTAPSHLILAVHGIGQKLAGKFGYDFVNDVNALRTRIIGAAIGKGRSGEDIYVLPINWRNDLKMSTRYFFDEQEEEFAGELNMEDLIVDITLKNIPIVRSLASDVALDILLYMTPVHFKRIIKATLSEIRRIYTLFLKWGGVGSENTKISFFGHSLGATIVSDLIAFQETASETDFHREYQGVIKSLGFHVNKSFMVGSPLSMLFLLKQLRPIACIADSQDIQDLSKENGRSNFPSLPELQAKDEDSSVVIPRRIYFACNEVYNIFHPYDPIAYRMEPLIIPPNEMTLYTYPVLLPYYKKGARQFKHRIEQHVLKVQEQASKARQDLVNTLNKTVNTVQDWIKNRIAAPENSTQASEEGQVVIGKCSMEKGQNFDLRLRPFNRHGRLDFSLQDELFENAYISAVSSHFAYWDDIDVASFLVGELLEGAGQSV